MKKKQKGILGLDTVRIVIITLLILAVTAIAVFLALVSLEESNLFADSSLALSFINETINLNDTGSTPSSVQGLDNVVLSNIVMTNSSGGEVVTSANYTVVAGAFFTTGGPYNQTDVNVSASASYTQTRQATTDTSSIVGNITGGTTEFFNNVPTYMILLGVVVLLLIIAIILVVVGRFGSPTVSGSL